LDGDDGEIEPVVAYLRDRALGDASPLTCRSYGHGLLRWFRLLWYLDVAWDRATETETSVLVRWLRRADNPQRRRTRADAPRPGAVNRRTGKPEPGPGYATATIAHALTVVFGFYDFHQHFGRGPVVNPVPESKARRNVLAHRSPLEPAAPFRRARLRPQVPVRQPRSMPDALYDEVFDRLHNDRDRALLSFYVSSGARAGELLGVGQEDVSWPDQQIWVVSKGTRTREAIPASPEAFTFLARYLDIAGPPPSGTPIWRTLRGPQRPLSYWAMRQVIERANTRLGTNWSLHDLRHTAATRMASDPRMTLPEVQMIMRHAHVTTTQLYTVPHLGDLVDKLAEHYGRPKVEPQWSGIYDPDDVRTVFGG
jgi:integrase